MGEVSSISGSEGAGNLPDRIVSVKYQERTWSVITTASSDTDKKTQTMMLAILKKTSEAGGEDAFAAVASIKATPVSTNHEVTSINIEALGKESGFGTSIKKAEKGTEEVFEGIAGFFAHLDPAGTTVKKPINPVILIGEPAATKPKTLEEEKTDALKELYRDLIAILDGDETVGGKDRATIFLDLLNKFANDNPVSSELAIGDTLKHFDGAESIRKHVIAELREKVRNNTKLLPLFETIIAPSKKK